MKKNLLFLFLFIVGITVINPVNATVRYVKTNGTTAAANAANATSWATACNDLQATINASAAGDQVWVAAGEYQPAAGQSFAMVENVKIYGGFPATASGAEPVEARNPATHLTTLRGNGSSVIRNDNNGLTTAAVLDGFTITGGSTSDRGGGIFNSGASPRFANLTITGNTANNGGGICNLSNSTPILTNVVISGNTTRYLGGGIVNDNSSPTLVNVTISGNTASLGGGMCNDLNSSPILTNVTISGNTANSGGGGMYNWNSDPKIYNIIVLGNSTGILNISSTTDIQYSLVQGLSSNENGNIDATNITPSAVFVNWIDPAASGWAPTAAGDYRLRDCTPVINAGSLTAYNQDGRNAATATDLAGNPRLVAEAIDLGAYENAAGYAPPAAPTADTPQTFAVGATVDKIKATPEGNNALKWYAAQTGGEPLAGSTPLENGATYYVSQTGANGCESARKAVTVTVTTGLADVSAAALKVYPNPVIVGGAFTVETDRAETAVLYDVNGKTIKTIVLAEGKNEVNTGKLPAGMYLLRTASGKQVKLAVK